MNLERALLCLFDIKETTFSTNHANPLLQGRYFHFSFIEVWSRMTPHLQKMLFFLEIT